MKPQIIIIVMMSLSLLIHAVKDGEPREGKYSLSLDMLSTGMMVLLLWWGGFWTPLFN